MRRGKWREIFRKKSLSALREWVFSPSNGPQESKEKLQKHWNYWKQHPPPFLSSLHIEHVVPRKIKSNRVPPLQSSELRCTLKNAIGPGPSLYLNLVRQGKYSYQNLSKQQRRWRVVKIGHQDLILTTSLKASGRF